MSGQSITFKASDIAGASGPPETTTLSAGDEAKFQRWARQNQITDVDAPDSHYDMRGFWQETKGAPHPPGSQQHFPDTYKQHGHPTFSQESKYSKGPGDGGTWNGDTFVPGGDTFQAGDIAPVPSTGPKELTGVPDIRGVPGRIVEGAARTLLPSTTPSDYIEGPLYAAQHPLDSLGLLFDAIKNGTLGQVEKARQATEATRTVPDATSRLGATAQAIGHTAAAAIPVLGPAAAHAGETIGQGDIAGGIGEAAGLLAPTMLHAAAPLAEGAAGKVGAVAEGVRGKLADAAGRGVERRMVDVTAPKTGANKIRFGKQMADIAPKLAREEGLGASSREGLQAKVEGKLAESEAALDDAANARLSARTFPTAPILAALKEKRARMTSQAVDSMDIHTKLQQGADVVPGPNSARVASIDQAISEIEQLGPQARYEPLRRIREAYDGPARAVYNPSMTADFLKAQGGKMGAADVTGVLREHLAKMDTETAAANADYSLFRKASDVLEAAKETEQVRPNLFRKTMGRIGGVATGAAVGGGEGAIAGLITAEFLDRLASSGVTTKIHTARLLATLEDALRGKRTTQVQSTLAKLQRVYDATWKASVATGRTQTAAATQ